MTSRICPSCGHDSYHARQFPAVRDRAYRWERKAKILAGKLAALELDLAERDARDRTDVAWLQIKVVAQARELQRLNAARNARLIRDGEAPQPDRTDATSITALEIGT